MLTLFPTILLVLGKVNFSNLSRYNDLCEKTYCRQYGKVLQQLPERSKVIPGSEPSFQLPLTHVGHYLNQLRATHPHFPIGLRYLVSDGFYSKQTFVDGVVALNLHLVSKLRVDADLRYLYTGSHKPKGRHRKYDGIDLDDLSRLTQLEALEPHRMLYTAVLWHVS